MRIVIKYLMVILFMISFINNLFANPLSAIGYGDNEEQAKRDALSNLSNNLYVHVDVAITSILGEEDGKAYSRIVKQVTTESNLPLLGTRFLPVEKQSKGYKITVSLEPEQAVPLYRNKLHSLHNTLTTLSIYLKPTHDSELRYDRLLEAKKHLEEYENLRYIYLALNGEINFQAPMTLEQINKVLYELTNEYDDLTLALKLSSDKMKTYEDIYIFYPSVYPSKETTQFSRVVKNILTSYLQTIENVENARYYLLTSYEIFKNGISLNLRLINNKGNILESDIIKLNSKAYKHYEYQPKTIDLAQQIEMGELISNKLNVQISGIYGSNQLFYTKDEIVQLKIKSNLPVEYFIIVHTHNDQGVYSYLLELNPAFINRIPIDQCNRWIKLPEFQVQEPFGVETLHVFASTGNIKRMLPSVKFDNNTGLYTISDNPVQAILLTRGLKPVSHKIVVAETSLTLTTMSKY